MKLVRVAMLLCSLCVLGFATDDFDDSTSVIPEPSMIVVMGAALAGIGAVTWRRNRKK
jgi:hypothetical protein